MLQVFSPQLVLVVFLITFLNNVTMAESDTLKSVAGQSSIIITEGNMNGATRKTHI